MKSTRHRFYCAFIAMLAFSQPLAAQGNCKTLLDALTRVMTTPTHLYLTMDVGGKPQEAESIYTATAIYIKTNGKWSVSPLTPADMTEQMRKNILNAKATCAYVKDEAVSGQSAALYTSHSETTQAATETQTWISKFNGLPLRSVSEINGGKIRTTIRYDYRDVKPPL